MRLPILLLISISVISAHNTAQPPQPPDSSAFLQAQWRKPPALSAADASRIDQLLKQMTLKEKVGQMTQLEIGMITDGQDANLSINPEKLRKAVADYGVGSIINVKDTALTVAKWHELLSAIESAAAGTRLKIR